MARRTLGIGCLVVVTVLYHFAAYGIVVDDGADPGVVVPPAPGVSHAQQLAGVNGADTIWYTIDLVHWTNIPGALTTLVVGDFNRDGKADLVGLNEAGEIWYTTDLVHWTNIPGALTTLVVGDVNGDGKADLVGLNEAGQIWYTVNLVTWTNIPGALTILVVGDFGP